MGRRSLKSPVATTNWLPGFEPEGHEAQGAVADQLQAMAMPTEQTRAVAVAAAMVANEAVFGANTAMTEVAVIGQVPMSASVQTVTGALEILMDLPVEAPKEWPAFVAGQYQPPAGEATRIDANLHAIALAKTLKQSGTTPTIEQRHELLRYAGWGGLARIFGPEEKNPLRENLHALQQQLTPREFESVRSTVTDAFYTGPELVQAIWSAVRRLGFSGGRVIEPTAGTGLFIAGMPADMAARSEITMVEKDTVSGEIMQAAFAGLGVNTLISGIESASLPHGFYDLAVGNVPFGNLKVPETRKVGYADWSIHNYVIGKCVDLVRPGGIVAVITSRFSLDSDKNGHRQWLHAHAELLGAIRLPKGAFEDHANTEVVTDILFLKKRDKVVYAVDAKAGWIQTMQAPIDMVWPAHESLLGTYYSGKYVEAPRKINEYFVKHPGMMLGKLEAHNGRYGKEFNTVFHGDAGEFATACRSAVLALPEAVYQERAACEQSAAATSLALNRIDAMEVTKAGSFVVQGGVIHLSEGRTWVNVDEVYTGKTRERMLGLIKIRDAAKKLIQQQSQSQDEAEFKSLQFALNTVYDAFVVKHGNVHDRANVRVFRGDPEFPLMLSLEVYNEDQEKYEKAAIFTRRTVGKREAPAKAANPREAMMISLAVHGRIVLQDMARRLGVSARQVVKELESQDLAFEDPEDGLWKPADEYLSGHIRDRIAAAQAAGKRFDRNVKALEAVIPPDLGPADVEVRLGAPWVPTDVIADFLAQLISAERKDVVVTYEVGTCTWAVNGGGYRPQYSGNSTKNCTTWGTKDRCAVELVEAALNQQPPKITRTNSDGTTWVDKKATLAAREKWEAIRMEFRKWAYAEEARRDRLLRIYNDAFNQIRTRRYDGSFLLLPGMSGAIVPYPHQLDAIWRIVSGGNTLLAHVVGAGKTFTMAAACMEMRRLGKAAKPTIIVPGHLLTQVTGDIVRFYPSAKVLMATKEDFAGDKRREFTARVATGDWDIVVMTHSTFERLPTRPERAQAFVRDLLDQARIALSQAEDSGAKRSVKECEKLMKTYEAKLERAAVAGAKDDLVYFDDLGIDMILNDEAHAHKSLMRISKMPRIAGLGNSSSNRAFDFWMKSCQIMEARGGKEEGIVMSTATPLSNTVAEAHTVMKYLMPQTLRRMGIYEFDAWAGTFGEAVTGMEVSPDGSGYRLNTRFSRFTNVPELMAIFRQVADIRTRSMVKLPTPRIAGGKPRTIVCQPSAELKNFTKQLVERAEKVRSGAVKPKEDNMLKITHEGRIAAMDMRMIDRSLPFNEQGKIAACTREVMRIWHATAEKRGTQLVFCDIGTPSSVVFSVYHELRKRLVEAGMPVGEIEFIHDHATDAAKDALFRRVRAGKVRVLMGSTIKLGTGTNVQRLLKAVHQLDLPWRPCDVEQRDGRGERPGNEWDEIELLRYVVEGSFDAYMAQTLEVKAGFIDQIMSGANGARTIEDISMGALTFAEIKAIASGNPLVLEKATIDAEVLKLSSLRSSWEDERWQMSMRKRDLEAAIGVIDKNGEVYRDEAAQVAHEAASGWEFIYKGSLDEKAAAAKSVAELIGLHLRKLYRDVCPHDSCTVGSVAGWDITVRRGFAAQIYLVGNRSGLTVEVPCADSSIAQALETGEAILTKLKTLVNLPAIQAERRARLAADLVSVEQELAGEFQHDERLRELTLRQRAIETALDLDKDQDGTQAIADSEGTMPASTEVEEEAEAV